MYLQNKYTEWYNSIINKASSRTILTSEYYELHHIIPRCMGGTNHNSNLVKLTAREHFICHMLLVKMVEDKPIKAKLSYAAWQMTLIKNRPRHIPSSKQYEILRKQLSENTKGIPKSEKHKAALCKPKSNTANMKGGKGRVPGFKQTEEVKLNLSLKMKGRFVGDKNPFFGKTHSEENREKWSKMFSGVPLSAEHRANIGKGLKGKPTWNKGIPASDEHRKNVSKSLVGDIYITNGIDNKRIKPDEFVNYDQTTWRRGKVRKNF